MQGISLIANFQQYRIQISISLVIKSYLASSSLSLRSSTIVHLYMNFEELLMEKSRSLFMLETDKFRILSCVYMTHRIQFRSLSPILHPFMTKTIKTCGMTATAESPRLSCDFYRIISTMEIISIPS